MSVSSIQSKEFKIFRPSYLTSRINQFDQKNAKKNSNKYFDQTNNTDILKSILMSINKSEMHKFALKLINQLCSNDCKSQVSYDRVKQQCENENFRKVLIYILPYFS